MAKKIVKMNLVAALLVVIAVLCYGPNINAGNLEPSAGPNSTMKTLDEVEPRIPISQVDIPKMLSTSGSYYLTEDVTTSGTAITVAVDDVTIDLAGFTLAGPDSGTNYGIYMNGCSNVEIRNGTVRDFYSGIYEPNSLSQNHRVINIRCVSNGKDGVRLSSSGNLVKGCTVSDNGHSAGDEAYGIYALSSSTVTGNTVNSNGSLASGDVYGVFAGNGSTVTGNTACFNGGGADGTFVYGVFAGNGSTVTGNTASSNGISATCSFVYGISADSGSTVIGNTAYDNGDSAATSTVRGIRLADNHLVDQNTAYSNGTGVLSAVNMSPSGSSTFGTNHAP